MESGAVFVVALSAVLLVLLIVSTLRWWRRRVDTLSRDSTQLNRNNNNSNGTEGNDDSWIFSIERGTDRQLIRYSTDEQQFNLARHTNCRQYASSEKSVDSKSDGGLPTYDEAMQAQQQHDIKLANSNAALTGSVV